jgi:ADP-ribose 1''-phosphate phosphatase
VILRNTGLAVHMLLELVKMKGVEVGEVRMCKVNSGKFGVEWERTEEVLKGIVLREGWRREIGVWEP